MPLTGIVFFTALASFLLANRLARGITFASPENSDEQRQVATAAKFGEWKWPSEMHRFSMGKARTKDVGVLGLAITQRILGDRKGQYPLTVFCNFVTAATSILLFLTAAYYSGEAVGFLVFVLFLTSLWPYQIALLSGYHCLAMACFLTAVLFLQIAGRLPPGYEYSGYAASGMFLGALMFSSASARKFLPLFAAAFLFDQREAVTPLWSAKSGLWLSAVIAVMIGIKAALKYLKHIYPKVITAVYYRKAPNWMNKLIQARETCSLQYYLNLQDQVVLGTGRMLIFIVLTSGICLFLSRSLTFYAVIGCIASGFILSVLFFLYPNIVEGAKGYWSYWTISKWGGHLKFHDRYFVEKTGRPVREGDESGRWLAAFLWRMMPFHFAYCLFLLGALGWIAVGASDFRMVWEGAGILLVCLSPWWVGAWTKGPNISRAYFGLFSGILLWIGYGTFQMERALSPAAKSLFWYALSGYVLWSAAWSAALYWTDVLPSRMTVANLISALDKLGVKKIFALDTPYNFFFAQALPKKIKNRYEIQPVRALSDMENGYVLVPPTTSKAYHLQSADFAIQGGDYRSDPLLNELLDSKRIRQCAVASFKTFGSSRMWACEGDVATYQDLILKDISEEDRWRGLGWIVDAARARSYLKAVEQPV